LGFTVRIEEGKHRYYTHETTGALVVLPDHKRTEAVSRTHLAGVRKVLADYEIADEMQFLSKLQNGN
jgi:hypothetical protein